MKKLSIVFAILLLIGCKDQFLKGIQVEPQFESASLRTNPSPMSQQMTYRNKSIKVVDTISSRVQSLSIVMNLLSEVAFPKIDGVETKASTVSVYEGLISAQYKYAGNAFKEAIYITTELEEVMALIGSSKLTETTNSMASLPNNMSMRASRSKTIDSITYIDNVEAVNTLLDFDQYAYYAETSTY